MVMVPPTSPASSSPSGCTGGTATVGDVVGNPPGVGHDRQGRVRSGPGREWPTVDHEQVVDLVRLAPAVQHRRLGVVAHAGGAVLVRAVAGNAVDVDAVDPPRAGCLQDL